MKQGWEIKKLGDSAYIGLGFTHTPVYVEKGVAFLSVKDISSGKICWDNIKYVSQQEYDSAPRGAKPSKGDIMFCRVGTMGKPVIIDTDLPFCTFVSLGYLHLLEKDIINTYVKYWMQSNSFEIQVEANVKGIAIKNLNTGWLKTFDIPVPPREEQERIVAELDCLSGVIEKKKQQLKELDTLAQSIFYQMFGDPITNEKGWEVKKLGEVCKFSQGVQVDLPLQSTEKKSGWNRFLRIVDYTTCNTDIRYVNISNDKYFVNFDDVVVVRYGASAGFVGIEKEGILANNLFKLNHDRNKLNYKYLYYLLSTDYYKDFVKDIAFGAAMPALSFNSFKNFNIYSPPIALQQEFADKIEAIERQKELIKESIKETETLFKARMDYYFN